MSTTGGFHGADPEQLDALARLFSESADRLNEIVGSVRGLAQQAVWAGADAERFRAAVHDELGGAAARAAELVRAAGEDVRRNAAQQREASGDGGAVNLGSAGRAAFVSVGATSGRGISDVLAGGPPPADDWHESPRVSALIELCEPARAAGVDGFRVGDLLAGDPTTAAGLVDPAIVRADTLEVPSNWARQALGSS